MSRIARTIIGLLLTFILQEWTANAQDSQPEILTLERPIARTLDQNRELGNAKTGIFRSEFSAEVHCTQRFSSLKCSTSFVQPINRTTFTFEKDGFGDYSGTGPIPAERTLTESSFSPTILLTGKLQQPLSSLNQLGLNSKILRLNTESRKEQELPRTAKIGS